MALEILPTRTVGAAENMALDFLLLQRYPRPAAARFRHYEWRAPAFTFGYAQKIAFVRESLPADQHLDLCRRPTGGGIVDHRQDWTYALVIPRGHSLEEKRAQESYRSIHEALAAALREHGVPAEAKSSAETRDDEPAGICFERAEVHDVIHGHTGAKIAGAAQKRNKHGLLFQGSIDRQAINRTAFDWDRFELTFVAQLAITLGEKASSVPWPDLNEDEVTGLTEQYASPEWLEHR